MPIIDEATMFKILPPIKTAAAPVKHRGSLGLYVIQSATIFEPSNESTQPKIIIKNVIAPIGRAIKSMILNTDRAIRMTGAIINNIKGVIFGVYVYINTI